LGAAVLGAAVLGAAVASTAFSSRTDVVPGELLERQIAPLDFLLATRPWSLARDGVAVTSVR